MLRVLLFSFLMGTLAMLQGCSSGPSLENQPYYKGPMEARSDSATVYVFRPTDNGNRFVNLSIKLDEQPIAELPSGGYIKLQMPEGTHLFEAATPPLGGAFLGDRFNISVKKGNVYFIAAEVRQTPPADNQTLGVVKDGRFGGEHLFFRWAMVPQLEAELRMRFCQLVPAKQS